MLVFAAGASLVVELSADVVQQLIETSIALRRPQTTMLVVHRHCGGEVGGRSLAAVLREPEAGGRRSRRQGEVAVEAEMGVDDDDEDD